MTPGSGNGNGASGEVLVDVRNLKKYFPVRRGILGQTVGYVKAVDGVSSGSANPCPRASLIPGRSRCR